MTEWISVKDQLPPPMQEVRIKCMYKEWKEPKEYSHTAIFLPPSNAFYDAEEITYLDHVSHWMPLPEPPNPAIFRERPGEFEGISDECNL